MRIVLIAAAAAIRRSLIAILQQRGHEVIDFAEAAPALARIESDRESDALIVVDSEMETPGPEICWDARLLASFERPIYVALISRPLSSRALIEALDCGADDVLQMPISSDELYARLRAAERMNQMQRQLVEMATRDCLTGLYNRQAFFRRADRECRAAAAPLAALMVDIDHFKSVNDAYGHAAGDIAIVAVAARLKGVCDTAGRLGGEEFALLLDHGDAENALREAEDLRLAIAGQDINLADGVLRLTCSIGVAVGAPGEDIDQILRKADAALYDAKRSGRNSAMLFDPQRAPPQAHPSVIRGPRRAASGSRQKVAS